MSTLVKAVIATTGLGLLAYQLFRRNRDDDECTGDKVKNGVSMSRYKNGAIHTVAHKKDGKLNGVCIQNYSSGSPKSVANYVEDLLHGRFTSFYPSGRLRSEVDYEMGKCTRVVSLYDHAGRDCVLGDGEQTVWKVAVTDSRVPVYVRLTVPENAKRVTPDDGDHKLYKARVEFAKVEEIFDREGNRYQKAFSAIHYRYPVTYNVGEVVGPDFFNADPSVQCGNGIHVHRYKDHCDQWEVWGM